MYLAVVFHAARPALFWCPPGLNAMKSPPIIEPGSPVSACQRKG